MVQPTFLSKFLSYEQNWIKIIADEKQKKMILKRLSNVCEYSIKVEVALRKVCVSVNSIVSHESALGSPIFSIVKSFYHISHINSYNFLLLGRGWNKID